MYKTIDYITIWRYSLYTLLILYIYFTCKEKNKKIPKTRAPIMFDEYYLMINS